MGGPGGLPRQIPDACMSGSVKRAFTHKNDGSTLSWLEWKIAMPLTGR